MPHQTVLIIRHAEKPAPGDGDGVDASGGPDHRSLTPRGWQRAGAWAELFLPALNQPAELPKPTALFASAPASHAEIAAGAGGSKSRRPLETIAPLAAKLGLDVDLRFVKDKEADLVAALANTPGVALVCWQHENIAAIAKALAPHATDIPAHWPDECFNVIFRFDRPDPGSPRAFQQIVPVMLQGDSADKI